MKSDELYTINSIDEMEGLAKLVASNLAISDVVCLYGDLGSGKTTFCKYVINAFYPMLQVTSPTFSIMQSYSDNIAFSNAVDDLKPVIHHYDLYRLASEDELYEISILENIHNSISLIEWPEIAERFLPKNRIDIYLTQEKDRRIVRIRKMPLPHL